MCRKRKLIPAEVEAEQAAFTKRLMTRIEINENPPRNQPVFCWEEVWAEQVPFFHYHARKVHPLFSGNSAPLSPSEVNSRFLNAYRMAAKDFVMYLLMEHEDCPYQWVKPKWVSFIRKLYLQALRHFPLTPLSIPSSSSITTPSDASTVSSDGQCFPQPNRSQPRWGPCPFK